MSDSIISGHVSAVQLSGTAGNLHRVANALETALLEAGRPSGSVRIVAVSKQHDSERILPVLKAGHRIFGENRVQETALKWPGLRERYPDIHLHLVGPLQSNKAVQAVTLFDTIQTLDRPKIAAAIAGAIGKTGKKPRLMVQVNTGSEPRKSGVAPQDAKEFVTACTADHGLEIDGLMCIPPVDEDPEPHFTLLAGLAHECSLSALSMGMSADYAAAARAGATHVRIGSGIFGARRSPAGAGVRGSPVRNPGNTPQA